MLPGDPNRDNQVNFTDSSIVQSNMGNAGGWSIGNFDANATVDLGDFAQVSNNFGYNWNTWASLPAGPGAPMAPPPPFQQKMGPLLDLARLEALGIEADLDVLAAARFARDAESRQAAAAGWWAAYAAGQDEEPDPFALEAPAAARS